MLIYYHHYGFDTTFTEGLGDFAVTFFFMLSGFVLWLSMQSQPLPDLKHFLTRRIGRVFPLYIITWIVAIAVLPYSGFFRGKLLGLLALQSWMPIQDEYFAGNPVGWFISDLFFFYLLLIPLCRLHKLSSTSFYAIIIAYFIGYFAVSASVPSELVEAIVYINPLMQLSAFLIGILLCQWFLSSPRVNGRCRAASLQLLSVTVIACSMICYGMVNARWGNASYWWIAAGLCILTFSMTDRATTLTNRLLQSSLLMMVGRLSFSFYLIHVLCIKGWDYLLTLCGLQTADTSDMLLQSVILLPIVWALAYLLNRYVERPISKLLSC